MTGLAPTVDGRVLIEENPKELLFLAHRFPYPPNKGDKIRSYHVLKALSKTYRVHLGAFVDSPEDWRYADHVRALCGETCLTPLHPRRALMRSLRGLVTGEALSLPYYRDARLAAWVARMARERPLSGILVFSSPMSQYVQGLDQFRRVVDFVDVDSDKWLQYASLKNGPARWIYRREGHRLLAYERAVASRFERSLFVSEAEAALFRRLAPESAGKAEALENGVDSDYFNADGEYPSPYAEGEEVLLFTGVMDYWPNVDAVAWFAGQVFPELLRQRPDARFYVVGARPARAVSALANRAGVVVSGGVEDIRPYLAHARLVVAPLRVARGVQNKVLEAMAMGRSLLATAAAIEGVDNPGHLDLCIADSPEEWLRSALSVLADDVLPQYSCTNRQFARTRYAWERNLARLEWLW